MSPEPEEPPTHGPVVRDKRRLDPVTGEVREPPAASPSPAPGPGSATPPSGLAELEQRLAERTSDLQRLQAEYVNYKRRVDRDRETARQNAVAATLAALLPVLDDIGRAREHGELVGGFKAVADSFERVVTGLGLEPFGDKGDPFDPRIHEAIMHSYADDVDGPVCAEVLQVGYRFGDRIVRPARVSVAEPTEALPPSAEALAEPSGGPGESEPAESAGSAEPAADHPGGSTDRDPGSGDATDEGREPGTGEPSSC